jgi:hypothetical protein
MVSARYSESLILIFQGKRRHMQKDHNCPIVSNYIILIALLLLLLYIHLSSAPSSHTQVNPRGAPVKQVKSVCI